MFQAVTLTVLLPIGGIESHPQNPLSPGTVSRRVAPGGRQSEDENGRRLNRQPVGQEEADGQHCGCCAPTPPICWER